LFHPGGAVLYGLSAFEFKGSGWRKDFLTMRDPVLAKPLEMETEGLFGRTEGVQSYQDRAVRNVAGIRRYGH
jgi:hypothetical protein